MNFLFLSQPISCLSANLDSSVFKAYLESDPFYHLHCCHLSLAANLSHLDYCSVSALVSELLLFLPHFSSVSTQHPESQLQCKPEYDAVLLKNPRWLVPWVTWIVSIWLFPTSTHTSSLINFSPSHLSSVT